MNLIRTSVLAVSVSLSAFAADVVNESGTTMKPDGDMKEVLTTLAGMGGKPIETLTPAEARKQPTPTDAVMQILKKKNKPTDPEKLVPGVTTVDKTITLASGPMAIRMYTPSGKGPFPVVVYFHGGGWVLANKEVYDGGARGLAKYSEAIVISPDYRLAPENKFPAAHDDALAVYKWAAENATSINGDPKRMALAGESAGGNLAIATAIAVRENKLTRPTHVLAVYPVAQASDVNTPSYLDSANAKPLNKAMMEWFPKQFFRTPDDKADPRIDLIHASLAGLPPVTLISARIDPLRSDSDLLEDALKKASVPVEHKIYEGVTHEFFGMAAVVSKAKDAQEYGGKRLKASFKP